MLGLLSKLTKASPASSNGETGDVWIEGATIPVALVDAQGRILKSSRAFQSLSNSKSLPLPDANGVIEDVQTASKRWLRLSVQKDDRSTTGQSLYFATDITDLKNDYYRQLLDTFQDCVKVMDTRGRLLFLNTAGRQVLSVAPDQPLGMLWTDLLPPGIHDKINQIIEQVVSGEVARFSNQSQIPGREAETWQHTLMPYRDPDGRVMAILCMSRNITADYKTQQTTRQNEERLELAAKVAGLGIWDMDLETGRIHCNATWYEVMAIPQDTAIPTITQFLPYVHPDDLERVTSDWRERENIIQKYGEYKTTLRRITDDGKILNIRVAAALVRDIADQPVRAIGFVSRIETE